MRYDHLQAKRPQTLDIGLESFIVGPVAFNEKQLPLGNMFNLKDAVR